MAQEDGQGTEILDAGDVKQAARHALGGLLSLSLILGLDPPCDRRHLPSFRATRFVVSHKKHPFLPVPQGPIYHPPA
jgi:hypothetical protein